MPASTCPQCPQNLFGESRQCSNTGGWRRCLEECRAGGQGLNPGSCGRCLEDCRAIAQGRCLEDDPSIVLSKRCSQVFLLNARKRAQSRVIHFLSCERSITNNHVQRTRKLGASRRPHDAACVRTLHTYCGFALGSSRISCIT